jgi:site-specific recombinase
MTIASDTMNEVQKPEGGVRLTDQQLRARRSRSIAIALALGAFVVVIFVVTLVKLGSNVLTRPM